MKKIFLSLTTLCLSLLMQAQSNPVDEMFNKYSEKQGFTVVSISGKMFSMFANTDVDNKDADNVISKLKSIKILLWPKKKKPNKLKQKLVVVY